MARKKKKDNRNVVQSKKVDQTSPKNTFQLQTWMKYLLAFLFLALSVTYMYQEPVYQNKVLTLADSKGQGVPFDHYKKEFEKNHNEPALWIPYIFSGMPYHASGSYRLRYTVESLYQFVPSFFSRLMHSSFGLNILLGGIFMLILMRSFGVGILGSLLAAVAFVFTTKVIGTPHTNRLTTFMHIPLIFYAVKEIWKKPRWWLILVLGGALGSQIGSYHPQVSHITGIFVLLYILFSVYNDYKNSKELKPIVIKGSYLLAGLVLALFMAAIVIIPLSEYMPYSIRGAKTAISTGASGGLSASYATAWSFSWTEIITFFIPAYTGFGYETYWGQMPFTTFPNYLGVSVLILAFFYSISAKKDPYRYFWIGSFFIVLFIALGSNLPPVSYIMLHYFPYFNKFREPSMMTILNSLIAAIMAGLFLTQIQNISEEYLPLIKTWIKRLSIFFGVLLVGFILFSGPLKSYFFDIYQGADKEMERYTQYSLQQLTPLYEMRFKMLSSDVMRIGLIELSALGLLWVYFQKKISYTLLSILFLAIVVFDLFVPDRQSVKKQYTSTSKPQTYYQAGNPVADWFKANETMETYRILPVEDFASNEFVYFGIPSVGGYHAVKMANYQAYLDEITFNNRLLLNMLATKYIVSSRQFQLPGTMKEANIEGKNIYKNLEAMPYVRFVNQILVENDKEKIRKAIKAQNFNVGETAYISSDKDLQNQDFPVDSLRSIAITDKNAQLIEFKTQNQYDGLCIIAEMHYPPGWRAYIDENPVDINLINAGIMGIFVPSGIHTVRVHYEQPSFYVAKAVSQTSFWGVILVLLALAGLKIYKSRKFKSNEKQ